MSALKYSNALPSALEFRTLRNSTGWGDISLTGAKCSLENSLCTVTAREPDGELVAVARAIGDGVLNIYIQDVIVTPNFRKQGVGRQTVEHLLKEIKAFAPAECTVGLMAAFGQDRFYERLGFTARPTNTLGAGFTASLQTLANSSLRA